jgi:hypothetical protein
MKYIDAEKLKEQIECIGLVPTISSDYNDGRDDIKMMVLDLIDSLQQESIEVDLEKEINEYCGERKCRPVPDFMEAVARHFYELGRNARKEE